MPIPTIEELLGWFHSLADDQRICRTWVRTESYAHICARAAVGIDRLGGKNALVCEAHKPLAEASFARLSASENPKVDHTSIPS